MKTPEVVIIGLGYIGLPTAALIASKKLYVHGVDINQTVVNTINRGEIHIVEEGLGLEVAAAVKEGYLCASTIPVQSRNYIIVVPTPFKNDKQPDISYIESAILSIIPFLKPKDLVIIESTSPIGTTEKIMEITYFNRPELRDEIFFSYCPERVLPGNIMYELVNNDRVIGGVNVESTKRALDFYSSFVEGELHSTNARTAEMCKLVENSSRDVQIAFANELSMICSKAEIDVRSLIDLANKHPRVNILQPGCGVGGHCIAVDPYFIVSDFPNDSKIISTAREVNSYKPKWCVEKIRNAQLEFKLKYKFNPKTVILGLAFKPNIDDLRESPAEYIAKELFNLSNDMEYFFVEPNVNHHHLFKLSDFRQALLNSNIVVCLVAHDEFKEIRIDKSQVLLDFCGIS